MKLKEEKGLTLVELLATLVILAIIATIAVLSIGQIIKNTKEKAIIADGLQLIEAAKLAEAEGVKCTDWGGSWSEVICTYSVDEDLKPYLGKDLPRIIKNLGTEKHLPLLLIIKDGEKIKKEFPEQFYIEGEKYRITTYTGAKIRDIPENSKYYPGIGSNKYKQYFFEIQLKNALEGKGQENKKYGV